MGRETISICTLLMSYRHSFASSLKPKTKERTFDLHTSHVIPALIRKLIEAKGEGRDEVVLWGDGSPTREFLYVEDAAEGILLATERYNGAEPINLGSGEEISIRELAQMIAQEVGYTGRFMWDTTQPNGQPRRCLDVTSAKEFFGFQASHPLRAGIRNTVGWFLSHRGDLRQVNF